MTKQPSRDTLCVITVNGLPERIKEPTQTLLLRSSQISIPKEHLRRHYSDTHNKTGQSDTLQVSDNFS
jgi:hypothetical protein